MESIHRHLLSSVRRRKYDVVNFIILATGGACDRNDVIVSRLLHNFASKKSSRNFFKMTERSKNREHSKALRLVGTSPSKFTENNF